MNSLLGGAIGAPGAYPGAAMPGQPGMPGAYPAAPMPGQPGMQGVPGQPGLPNGMPGNPATMPLSQPPTEPIPPKVYVKMTPIETAATVAATAHISFLWSMIALLGGVGLGLSCALARNKTKKKGDSKEASRDGSSGDSSSSDSE